MLVFQCENPCALSGVTMTECVTLLFFSQGEYISDLKLF